MKRFLNILILSMLTCCMNANNHDVETFVTGLLEQYPEARLLDIYKSCFQDYMGAEHLVGDTTRARAYLEQELSTVDVNDLLPWYYEPCGIEGNHIRVSLRSVIEGKVSAEVLLKAFIASANETSRHTVEEWAEKWHDTLLTIEQMSLDLPHYEEDKSFIEGVLEQDQYAISHSPEYREAYSPHYRIVERSIFEQQIQPLLSAP